MKRMVMTLVAGLALITPQVQADPDSGFYMGVGVGTTVYADDDLAWETGFYDLDDEDSGYKVYAGYQINKIMGIEASYVDYGTFKAYNGANIYRQDFKATHIAANAGYTFLQGQLRPFGNIGLGYIEHDATGSLGVIEDDVSNHSFYFGLGVQYEPKALQGMGLRVGYDVDVFDRDIYDGWWHREYAQGIALWYVALQYRF